MAFAAVVVVVTTGRLVHLSAAVAHGLCVFKPMVLVVSTDSILAPRAVAVPNVLTAERMPTFFTAHFFGFLWSLCSVLF